MQEHPGVSAPAIETGGVTSNKAVAPTFKAPPGQNAGTGDDGSTHQAGIVANKAATDAAIAATQEEIAATQHEVAANKTNIDEVASSTQRRFSEIGEVVTKDQYTVLFASGDYSLSKEYKEGLANLAKEALAYHKGWVISVAGYADSVGNPASNQVLSKQRAQAVVAYLLQDCGVPVGRIVAPGAMGESNPAASNESASGRADNRRVDVKLLLNEGGAGRK